LKKGRGGGKITFLPNLEATKMALNYREGHSQFHQGGGEKKKHRGQEEAGCERT